MTAFMSREQFIQYLRSLIIITEAVDAPKCYVVTINDKRVTIAPK